MALYANKKSEATEVTSLSCGVDAAKNDEIIGDET